MSNGKETDVKQITESLKNAEKETKKVKSAADKVKDAWSGATGQVTGFRKAIKQATTSAEGLMSSLTGVGWGMSLESIITHVNLMSDLTVAMNKTTGAAGLMGKALKEHRKHADGMAVGYKELTEHHTAMRVGMTDFTKESTEVQGKLAGMASKMTKLGVETKSTAALMNTMTKSLGFTAEEAIELEYDIAKISRTLGVAPAQMVEDFNKAGPKLAQYGTQAFNVFKKLAAQAKATGMEMQSLLNVTEKFDTFEGAAEQTAMLNAVMGTTLNSVDMLMATEGERIEMLKGAVEATGKSWDSMDRWERKALAQAGGFKSVDEAAKLFGATQEDLDDAAKKADPALTAQEELNAAMKRGVSRGQAMEAMLEGIKSKFASAIMPMVRDFLSWFKDNALTKMIEAIEYFRDDILPGLKLKWKAFYKDNKVFFDKWGGWILGIILAIAPLIPIITGIAAGFTAVTGIIAAGFMPAILGIGALLVMIAQNWSEVEFAIRDFYNNAILPFMSGFLEGWNEVWPEVWATFKDVWDEIELEFMKFMHVFGVETSMKTGEFKKDGKALAKEVGEWLKQSAKDLSKLAAQIGGIIKLIKNVGSVVTDVLAGNWGNAMKTMGNMMIEFLVLPFKDFFQSAIRMLDNLPDIAKPKWLEKFRDDSGELTITAESFGGISEEVLRRRQREANAERAIRQQEQRTRDRADAAKAKVKSPAAPAVRSSTGDGTSETYAGAPGGGGTPDINIYFNVDREQFVHAIIRPEVQKQLGLRT